MGTLPAPRRRHHHWGTRPRARRARWARWSWVDLVAAAGGLLAALAVAVAWIPLRSGQPNVEVGLLLVAVVTAVGVTGRRAAVVAAALSAAVSFTYFDTEPYEHFAISRQPDVVTAISLVVVGLVTGELALRVARQRGERSVTGDLSRIREAASLLATGEELVVMIGEVAQKLRRQLHLQDCWFEAETIPPGTLTVERDGTVRARTASPLPGSDPGSLSGRVTRARGLARRHGCHGPA